MPHKIEKKRHLCKVLPAEFVTPLFIACAYGQLEIAKFFSDELELPFVVNSSNALCYALGKGCKNEDLLRWLIFDKKVPMTMQSFDELKETEALYYGWSAFQGALAGGNKAFAVWLLEDFEEEIFVLTPAPTKLTYNSPTLFFATAIYYRHWDLVRWLISMNLPSFSNPKMLELQMGAVAFDNGDEKELLRLLDDGTLVHLKPNPPWILLALVARIGDVNMAKEIVKRGADPFFRAPDMPGNYFPCFLAAQEGRSHRFCLSVEVL